MKNTNKNKLEYSNIKLSSYQIDTYPNCRKYRDWVYYGEHNNFPQQLIDLNNKSALNNAILKQKVSYICGLGIDDTTYVGMPNINETWDEFIEKIATDYTLFGGFAFQIIQNKDGKSISIYHTDFSTVRVGQFDEYGTVYNYYISNDWSKTSGRMKPIQLKAWGSETVKQGERYLYYYKNYNPNLEFYPIPDYFSAMNYIQADADLGEFYKNSINNGFTPSVIITIPSVPSDEEKEQFQTDLERNFSGAKGASSFMVLYGQDTDVKPTIEKFEAANNADIYNNVNDIIFQRIISAHRLASPTLAGIQGNGNLSGNADEMINGYILYNNTVILALRRKILDVLNQFIIINGYQDKLKIKELPVIEDIMNSQATVTKDDATVTNNNDDTTKQ